MDHGPIFIGGLERSGKTYLRFMLSSHPNMAVTRRTNLWPHFYNRYGDLSRSENFERCLAAMLRYKHVRFLKPDAERIRREFRQGEPTYARLFALLHEHYAEQEGKARWGDQTELVESYADLVFAAYPTARMIQMIRDPRDQYEASLARGRHRRWRAGAATARWLESVRLAERNQQRYANRYKVVRYETMVSQPEKTLREVCAFLGERYIPAMIALEGVARFSHDSDLRAGSSPLLTDFIGRFRQRISKHELAFMQNFAGREMKAYGYPLEPTQLSFGERLFFYCIEWPVNLARTMVWRTLETVQRLSPIRFGRKPGRGKAKQGSLQAAAK